MDRCRGKATTSIAVSILISHVLSSFGLARQLTPSADAPEKIPYAINRYQTETKRLYQVLNDRLASERKINNIPAGEAAYLVGNKYTLSDICVFSWGESCSFPTYISCQLVHRQQEVVHPMETNFPSVQSTGANGRASNPAVSPRSKSGSRRSRSGPRSTRA